jgi:uncharacterized protein YigA (DUF484 family)
MTPDDVLQYLREHPEFLETYAGSIAELDIPHPEAGRAISIHERQLLQSAHALPGAGGTADAVDGKRPRQ